jgi:hypothetical protein
MKKITEKNPEGEKSLDGSAEAASPSPSGSTDPAYTTPWKLDESFSGCDLIVKRPDRRDPSGFSTFAFIPRAQCQIAVFIVKAINDAQGRAV